MTPAGLLAAVAALLASAAVRELLVTRDRPGGAGLATSLGGFPGQARILLAALKLGLPERLARSGLEARFPLPAVLLAKLAGAIVGGLAVGVVVPAAPGRLSLLVAIALPAAGFVLPDALLEREARRRHRRFVSALPDALDLLAVSSTSGRTPAAGFAEIARAGDGPLAAELRMAVAELGCGRPLAEALRSLRARVPGSEVATLCATIERSHRFGSPLADQLRRQAIALRRDQRRAVEERAARAAPKIQLVVALVLVPSVLLMIAAGLIANADLLLAGF
ncbi:MAG TPA: type II secretion system F family protein [Solirubrobacterales bacterium]|nr:type II secretion system F family protein [Solirubrobacterales bacterium]